MPLSLLVAIAMAGCGGGSTESTTQVQTKADFVSLADAICRNHESRTKDLESQTVDLGSIDSKEKAHQVAALLRQQADNLTAEAQELQSRKPPPADAGTVGSILGQLRAKVNLLGEWAKAYDDLDTARIRALQKRIGEATANARRAARAYGFEVCGRD